jgi:hypothetical protein
VNFQRAAPIPALSLENPISLGVFDGYEQAQRVLDYLSDHDFGGDVRVLDRADQGAHPKVMR